ncbi:hypothetical protein F8M41_003856 [Gigaspora margarita]|uniref:Uncharacterized protein n=1 Tax=Gigaspora margarita TaxID=4874 RepID=A0A8H3XBD1_GIGMA|nr:hypothetical protein F8M41_003856 [Gigaspora margarita]
MQKERSYTETIRIVCKAINIAIEKNDSCILEFLKKYIVQNNYSLIGNTASTSFSSQKTNSSKECSKSNVISKVLPVKVANPVKKSRRVHSPKTAHYQSYLETQQLKNREK